MQYDSYEWHLWSNQRWFSWHQVTSLSIGQPFNSILLHCLFSQLANLRTLKLHYQSEYDSKIGLNEENLIDLLSDASLCNMLLSNGLRQLNLSTYWNQPSLKNIAYLIVERIIKLIDSNDELVKMSHILINGLSKLNFLKSCGWIKYVKLYQKKPTRSTEFNYPLFSNRSS